MNAKREAEPALSHPPGSTTRPTPFPGNGSQRMIPQRSSGWDPYEVWRTRIKEPRDGDNLAEGEPLDSAG